MRAELRVGTDGPSLASLHVDSERDWHIYIIRAF
jgi:hypothetical protein